MKCIRSRIVAQGRSDVKGVKIVVNGRLKTIVAVLGHMRLRRRSSDMVRLSLNWRGRTAGPDIIIGVGDAQTP